MSIPIPANLAQSFLHRLSSLGYDTRPPRSAHSSFQVRMRGGWTIIETAADGSLIIRGPLTAIAHDFLQGVPQMRVRVPVEILRTAIDSLTRVGEEHLAKQLQHAIDRALVQSSSPRRGAADEGGAKAPREVFPTD